MIKIQYTDDREAIILANADKRLVGEHNHVDGNWLVFDDTPFDLTTREIKALLKLIIDQFNILRLAAGMNEITYQQAKDVIKAELGL